MHILLLCHLPTALINIICNMSRSPKRPSVDISIEQRRCDCLGSSSQSQQYFLQHKSLEIKKKQAPILTARHALPVSPINNAIKRSLKKSLRAGYQSPVTARSTEPMAEYYSPKKTAVSKLENAKEHKMTEQRGFMHIANSEKVIRKTESTPIEPSLARNNSQSGPWQKSTPSIPYAPISITQSPQRLSYTHTQPPIRINFSHSPSAITATALTAPATANKYEALPSPRQLTQLEREQDFRKIPVLSDIKQQMRIFIPSHDKSPSRRDISPEEAVDFELTDDNIETPKNLLTDRKRSQMLMRLQDPSPPRQQQPTTLNDYFAFGETFKSRIDRDKPKSSKKKQDPFKSKIETTAKSRIDTAKSRLQTKRSVVGQAKMKVKSLRDDKVSLRKMDDVQEIRSMVDSEEKDDDKESVVLGRLHEYGSVMDPTLSITTPTIRSKLISMNTWNTQSSITGKSFLKPFEFTIDRSHFK